MSIFRFSRNLFFETARVRGTGRLRRARAPLRAARRRRRLPRDLRRRGLAAVPGRGDRAPRPRKALRNWQN